MSSWGILGQSCCLNHVARFARSECVVLRVNAAGQFNEGAFCTVVARELKRTTAFRLRGWGVPEMTHAYISGKEPAISACFGVARQAEPMPRPSYAPQDSTCVYPHGPCMTGTGVIGARLVPLLTRFYLVPVGLALNLFLELWL